MGVQIIGPRKLRRLEQQLGMEVLHAVRLTNQTWEVFVRCGDGHRHLRFARISGEWEWHDDDCGFTTCDEGRWGPRMAPVAVGHAATG